MQFLEAPFLPIFVFAATPITFKLKTQKRGSCQDIFYKSDTSLLYVNIQVTVDWNLNNGNGCPSRFGEGATR